MKPAMMALAMVALGCAAPSSAPSLAAAPHLKAPEFPESGVIRKKLPAPTTSVTVAGGGRYLVFHLAKQRKLAIFDVTQAKITKYLPMGGDDLLIAGGMHHLVVVSRDHRVIQRWDLKTFQKGLTLALDEPGQIDQLAMGYASAGPVMLNTRKGLRFYDPQTLKRVSYSEPDNLWGSHPQYPAIIRASADGMAFTAWVPRISPNGIRLLTLEGNKYSMRSQHASAGYLIPSSDGSLVLTSSGVYSQELVKLNKNRFDGLRCLPALHPAYILGVKGVGPYYGQTPKTHPTLSIFTANDRQLLTTIPDLEELTGTFGLSVPLDQRVFFLPTANLLITLPTTNDEIVLRKLSIVDILQKSSIDYLFVESVPARAIATGETFTYDIATRSARGKVRISLDSGPEGMKLKRNRLTWKVPADIEPGPTSVILTLTDASGQEVFHSFTLKVSNDDARPKAPEQK